MPEIDIDEHNATEDNGSPGSGSLLLKDKLFEEGSALTAKLGAEMKSLGGAIREKLPVSGALSGAASALAAGLETGGAYLQERPIDAIAKDLTDLVRRHPIETLVLGAGVGYLAGRIARKFSHDR